MCVCVHACVCVFVGYGEWGGGGVGDSFNFHQLSKYMFRHLLNVGLFTLNNHLILAFQSNKKGEYILRHF